MVLLGACNATREGSDYWKKEHNEAISSSMVKASDKAFYARISELKDYKKKHGTITVKRQNAPKLWKWVGSVRHGYNQFIKNEGKTGKSSGLVITKSRIQALKELEFVFNPVEVKSENNFEAKFSQLVAFKKKHGHCEVGRTKEVIKDNRLMNSLNKWMNNIRCAYRQQQQGEPTNRTLKEEWIKRLDKLGFVWDTVLYR